MSQPPQGLPPHGQGGPFPGAQPGHQPGPGGGWTTPPPPQQGGGWGPPQFPPPPPGSYGPPPGHAGWPQQPAPGWGGPGGPAWGPQQPDPGGGKGPRTAWLVAGIAALVLVTLVVTVLALTDGGGSPEGTASRPTAVGTSPSAPPSARPSARPSAPPSSGPAVPAEVDDFLASLPADFTDCREEDLAGDGDLLSAGCGAASTQPGPTGARFYLYPDVATLDEVFAGDVEGSGLTEFPDDQDCSTGTGFGAWGIEGVTRGQVACTILGDDTVSIAWTDDEFLTEGIVSAPGSTQADVAELYTWWISNSWYQG